MAKMRRRVLAPKYKLGLGKGESHEALIHGLSLGGLPVDKQNAGLDRWAVRVLNTAVGEIAGPYADRLADAETQKKIAAAKAAIQAKKEADRKAAKAMEFLATLEADKVPESADDEVPDIGAANERPALGTDSAAVVTRGWRGK